MGKPHWAFPPREMSYEDVTFANKLANVDEESLHLLDRDMAARLPNLNDQRGLRDEDKFAYLESSVLPSQYMDALRASTDLVKRIGFMYITLKRTSVRRSLYNPDIVNNLERRADQQIRVIQLGAPGAPGAPGGTGAPCAPGALGGKGAPNYKDAKGLGSLCAGPSN